MKAMICKNGFYASSLLDFRKTGLALLLGTAGGGLFAMFGAPLAWLLGAMIVTTVATLSGARPEIPASLRTVMIAVLGIMLGSAFSPDLVDRLAGWSAGVAVMGDRQSVVPLGEVHSSAPSMADISVPWASATAISSRCSPREAWAVLLGAMPRM